MCVCVVQGLGLLINLVEYSARNKHCLMEMEMEGDQGPCDSTVLLNPQLQDLSSSGPLSAIAALVQVCGGFLSLYVTVGPSNQSFLSWCRMRTISSSSVMFQ